MKYGLVLRGGAKYPNQTKARNLGINTLLWEAEDPALDKAFFDTMRAAGWRLGIMRDPHWHADGPEVLAKKLHDDLVRLGCDNKQCLVQADIELHDNDYVLTFLKSWRALRPTRETQWTLEGFQGGWFRADLVSAINADPNLVVVPQAYDGNMRPYDMDQTKVDLLVRGVNGTRVKGYYGRLPGNGYWDGVAYDLNNIQTV